MRLRSWSGLGVAGALCLSLLHGPDPRADVADEAVGVVYHDLDGDGQRDQDEPGLPGVRVSNGSEVVVSGPDGGYRLPIEDDTLLFVIKPSGWRTALSADHLPRFYYNHKPAGSPPLRFGGVAPTGPLPASVDFGLQESPEAPRFRTILFADPQPRDQKELDYVVHDAIDELIGVDAAFGVTLGDILFDDLSLYENQSRAVGAIGIPWYHVLGNHDVDRDAPDDRTSDDTFERYFGPSYYSFDHGAVHFVVLDDVEWIADPGGRPSYRGGLGPRQIEFVRNDLALVPEDQLVVLFMHIPLVDIGDRQALYRLIEKRPNTLSISGHTHYHEHRFIGDEDGWKGPEPHHHIIHATVSGSWWSGAPDERGIPHTACADGTPNGYGFLSFDGSDYSLRFQAASQSEGQQMRLTLPSALSQGALGEVAAWVNVFNGSERSVVEMRVDERPFLAMQREVRPDPWYEALFAQEEARADRDWRPMSKPRPCSHLWRAGLPADLSSGTHIVEVRVQDGFGNTDTLHQVLRVTD